MCSHGTMCVIISGGCDISRTGGSRAARSTVMHEAMYVLHVSLNLVVGNMTEHIQCEWSWRISGLHNCVGVWISIGICLKWMVQIMFVVRPKLFRISCVPWTRDLLLYFMFVHVCLNMSDVWTCCELFLACHGFICLMIQTRCIMSDVCIRSAHFSEQIMKNNEIRTDAVRTSKGNN